MFAHVFVIVVDQIFMAVHGLIARVNLVTSSLIIVLLWTCCCDPIASAVFGCPKTPRILILSYRVEFQVCPATPTTDSPLILMSLVVVGFSAVLARTNLNFLGVLLMCFTITVYETRLNVTIFVGFIALR